MSDNGTGDGHKDCMPRGECGALMKAVTAELNGATGTLAAQLEGMAGNLSEVKSDVADMTPILKQVSDSVIRMEATQETRRETSPSVTPAPVPVSSVTVKTSGADDEVTKSLLNKILIPLVTALLSILLGALGYHQVAPPQVELPQAEKREVYKEILQEQLRELNGEEPIEVRVRPPE